MLAAVKQITPLTNIHDISTCCLCCL